MPGGKFRPSPTLIMVTMGMGKKHEATKNRIKGNPLILQVPLNFELFSLDINYVEIIALINSIQKISEKDFFSNFKIYKIELTEVWKYENIAFRNYVRKISKLDEVKSEMMIIIHD